MENKLIDLKRIKFEYKDEQTKDENNEQSVINNINMWFAQYADKINAQQGTINVYFDSKLEPHIYLDNMSDDLKFILHQKGNLVRLPHNH